MSKVKNLDLKQPCDEDMSHAGASPNTIYKSIVENSLRTTINGDYPNEIRANYSPQIPQGKQSQSRVKLRKLHTA